jgi:hypothetical protein
LNGTSIVWKHWSELKSIWDSINLVMNTLTFNIQWEDLVKIILTFESQLLLELLVTIWSDHNINCLLLSWLKNTTHRVNMESFTFFSNLISGRDIWFEVVAPLTRNFLLIFKSNFNSLSGLDTNFVEINIIIAHVEFWNCQVSNELNDVRWSTFNINWHNVLLFSELGCFSCCEDNIE